MKKQTITTTKNTNTDVRSERILFRCTKNEREALEKYLRKESLSISQHCRSSVFAPLYSALTN